MRVCFDASSVLRQPTGVGRYAAGLLGALVEQASEAEFTVLLAALRGRPQLPLPGPSARVRHARCRLPGRLLLAAWECLEWPPVETLAGRCDLFHSPNFLYQPVRRARVVGTVHDLYFLDRPDLAERRGGGYFGRVIGRHLARADQVICDSEATRLAVQERFGLPPQRLAVVPLGVDSRFRPLPEAEVRAALARLHLAGSPYVLFVGTLEPRKNLERLIAAFRQLRTTRRLPHRLVLAGRPGWHPGVMAAVRTAAAEGWLVHLGYVAEADLPALYGGAAALALPSLLEGFGLPVLEAMACGTPVVCSARGSLAEVAGPAAVHCDPESEESIAAALAEPLLGCERRSELAARGRARAALYSWPAAADATLAVYRRALEGR